MGRFDKIDLLLDELADQLQAKLGKDKPGIPDDLKIEERRLAWSEGNF